MLTAAPPSLTRPLPDLSRLPERTAVSARDGRHALLGGDAPLQLWRLPTCSPADLPAVVIPLDASLPARLAAALELWRRLQGEAPRPVRLPPLRRWRLAYGLLALDGRQAGASHREIARALFGSERITSRSEWKESSLRTRTMRLVADATSLMRGGYRELLTTVPPR